MRRYRRRVTRGILNDMAVFFVWNTFMAYRPAGSFHEILVPSENRFKRCLACKCFSNYAGDVSGHTL